MSTGGLGRSLEDLLGDLLKGSVLIFLGNLIGTGANFGARIVLANNLSASEYGGVVFLLTIVNTVSIFLLLGLPGGVAQRMPRNSQPWQVLISGLMIGASLPLLLLVLTAILEWSGVVQRTQFSGFPIMLIAVSVCAVVTFQILEGGLRGIEAVKERIIARNFTTQLFRLLLLIAGVSWGVGRDFVILLWFLPLGISIPVSYYWVSKRLNSYGALYLLSTSRGHLKKEVGKLIRLSLPLMLSASLWALMTKTDNILIAHFLQNSDLGQYDVAFTLSRSFEIIISTVGFLSLPIYSRLLSGDEHQEMKLIYRLVTKGMTVCAIPMYVVAVLHGDWIIEVIFGQSYSGSYFALLIIASGYFTHVVSGTNGEALTAGGRTKKLLYGNALALVSNLLLNVVLIPDFGIAGAAGASAASFLIINIYWSVSMKKDVEFFPVGIRQIGSVALSVGLCVLLFSTLLSSSTPTNISVALISSFFITISIYIWVGTSSEEHSMIWDQININT